MKKKKENKVTEVITPPPLVDNQATTKEQNMSSETEFESVNGRSNIRYVKAAELADLPVQGTYEGTEQGKFGLNHKIKSTDGTTYIVNGFGSLNSQMNKVAEGDEILLVYQGKKKISDGPMKGKEAHSVDVRRRVQR